MDDQLEEALRNEAINRDIANVVKADNVSDRVKVTNPIAA